VHLNSQPEKIDNLEHRKVQLEVEVHALEKEKDKSSKARLVKVGLTQIYISNFFTGFVLKHSSIWEIRMLKRKLVGISHYQVKEELDDLQGKLCPLKMKY
jgi:ATP-dependent Clp protease ATP-binding subunit ClpB